MLHGLRDGSYVKEEAHSGPTDGGIMIRTLLPLALVFGLAACADDVDTEDTDVVDTDTDTPMYDLTINGAGFDPHNGQTLEIAVLTEDDTIIDSQSTTVSEGTFSFSWDGALADGSGYKVHYYADLNENGGCDAPPDDHAWERVIDDVDDNITLDLVHSTDDWVDVCATFAE